MKLKKLVIAVLGLLVAGLVATPARADMVTFESDALGPITQSVTATNTVSYYVNGALGAWVHDYGTPRTAYEPPDALPTCVTGNCVDFGERFLSDEPVVQDTLVSQLPYGFSFLNPILSVAFDLVDFRGDGGNADTVVLTAFANSNFTGASEIMEIPIDTAWPDPSAYRVEWFGLGIGAFSSFTVNVERRDVLDADVGTGIDNITFSSEPVPEPGTLGLIGVGLFGIALRSRRRRR